MLFTPPPPSLSSASASVESESSPVHTSAVRKGRHVDKQPHDINSPSSNALRGTNGPSSSPSHMSPTADRDYFYSPLTCSSSSSHPSIPLTPTAELHSLNSHRRDSCPLVPALVQPKVNRFHFPSRITSSIRNVFMAATSPSIHHPNDMHPSPKATVNLRPNAMIVSVANPLALAADDDDDETTAAEDPPRMSLSPSPLTTPKASVRLDRSPTDCSTSLYQPPSDLHRKVILNVGGVRHEGKAIAASVSLSLDAMRF